jgi:hypothetical protein
MNLHNNFKAVTYVMILQLLFVDERKRASERIIGLTKEHEMKIREAVVSMMDMKGRR